MKVIINKCNAGFTISDKQKELLGVEEFSEVERHDPRFIESFEAGDRRGEGNSTLTVVEIPEGAHYTISEHNGYETLYWSETPIIAL